MTFIFSRCAEWFGTCALLQRGELGGERFELFLRQFFEIEQVIAGAADGPDQFVKFEMYGLGIAVLRALNKKDHDERDDGGSSIDDQLPGVGKLE